MKKRHISLLLCFLMLFTMLPISVSAYEVLPNINIFDQTAFDKGTAWFANQAVVEQYVANANALPDEDDTIYTIAKNSVIVRPNNNYGYIKGYRIYMDKSNLDLNAVIRDGSLYAPLSFMGLGLGVDVSFDEDTGKITLKSSSKTVLLAVDSTTMTVNGTGYTVPAPFVENGGAYVPVRAVSEKGFAKTVGFSRDVAIIASSYYVNMATDDIYRQIAHPQFMLSRDKILHPISSSRMTYMINTSYDDIAGTSIYNLRVDKHLTDTDATYVRDKKYTFYRPSQKDRYINSSYSELLAAVDEDLKVKAKGTVNIDGTDVEVLNATPTDTWRYVSYRSNQYDIENRIPMFATVVATLASDYAANGNEEHALRAAMMIYQYAMRYDNLRRWQSDTDSNFFDKYQWAAPMYMIYAYDRTYHSPMWEMLSAVYGRDVRNDLRIWWTTIFDYLYANRGRSGVSNNDNYNGHMAGIAVVLDSPEMYHKVISRMDYALKSLNVSVYADRMWYEGSLDYANTTLAYFREGVDAMRGYIERRCYTDADGITLDGSFDLDARWYDYSSVLQGIKSKNKLYMPDGKAITINDTHYTAITNSNATADTTMSYRKDNAGNVELNHFGLYGLRHGDRADTQQLNLSMQATSGISHQHSAPLGISYYSGGVEILPDIGYIASEPAVAANHRYAKNNVYGHNAAIAREANPTNKITETGALFLRPNVFAYDDGSTNGNKIQLIEGSNLMHSVNEITTNRRALMMIETEGNLSYLVDIQRLKGGAARESYLIQTEEEEVELETNIAALPETGAGENVTLVNWLKENYEEKEGTLVNANATYSALLKNPRGTKTSDDFWFTWTGKSSGTTLKAFIKGNDDSVVAFSKWPSSRGLDTSTGTSTHDTYHLYRNHYAQDKTKATIFGAVYEGYRKDAAAKVTNVEWIDPTDSDDMTAMLKVTLSLTDGIYTDYIYISNDDAERAMDGYTFKGSYAMLRVNASGEVAESYVYGAGEIKNAGGVINAGGETLSYNVAQAEGSTSDTTIGTNKLTVSELPTDSISGYWGNVDFSDGSGTAFRVEEVSGADIVVHNNPGFKMTETGAEFTAYPMYEDDDQPGKVAETVGNGSGTTPSGTAFGGTGKYHARKAEGAVTFTVKIPRFILN